MKKIIALLLAALMCILMCACSSKTNDNQTTDGTANNSSEPVSSTTETTEATTETTTAANKELNLDTAKGSIKYVGLEKANEGLVLVDAENVVLVKFDFTNKQDKVSQSQSVFGIQFFQNGVEIDDSLPYSSKGGEQYELAHAYFSEVLKGGTVHFACIVKLKDNSPLTILVKDNDNTDNQKMIEVSVKNGGKVVDSDTTAAEPVSSTEAPTTAVSTTKKANTVKKIKIGDRIKTKNLEFTLNNIELTYELKPKNTSSYYRSYPAEDGKVYVHVDGTYFNKSKKDVCIRDLFVPYATYNNEYNYGGFAVVDDGDTAFTWVNSYIVCTPLAECHYHGLIECPEIVDQTDDPLVVRFKIDGTTYQCKVR